MIVSSGAATWKEESLPLSSSQFTDVLSVFVAKFRFGLKIFLCGGRSNINVGKDDDLMVISLMVMFKVNKDGVVDLSVMLMVADLRPLLPQCLAAPQTGFHGYVKICSVDVLFTPTNPFRS